MSTIVSTAKRDDAESVALMFCYNPDDMTDDELYSLMDALVFEWDEEAECWLYAGK